MEVLVAKAVSDDGGRVATATVMAVARTAAAHHFADSGVGEHCITDVGFGLDKMTHSETYLLVWLP